MKTNYIILAVMLIIMCSLSFATIPTIRSGSPTEGQTLYSGDLSLVINTTGIGGFKNMTTNIYANGVLSQSNLSTVQQITLAVPLAYATNQFTNYIINISATNGTDTWYQTPLTFRTIHSINSNLQGIADVGTGVGDFFWNLISGLFPTIVLLAIIGMIVGVLVIVGVALKGKLKNGWQK